MPNRRLSSPGDTRREVREPPTEAMASGILVAIFIAAALAVLALPFGLVLPALSAILVLAGLAIAGGAHLKGQRLADGRPGGYQIAGALLLLGFAAALLADSEQALAVFERVEAQGVALTR